MSAEVKITRNIFAEKGADEGNKLIITKASELLTAQAKALCPIDKGQLRNSIMYKTILADGGFNDTSGNPAPSEQKIDITPKGDFVGKHFEGLVGTNSDHWYIEFGTRRMTAKPFMRPAKEIILNRTKAADIAKKYGRQAMEEEFKKRKEETK